MAWLSYLKVLAIAVVAPQLVSLLLWLGGFEAGYVRIAFAVSAVGLFIVSVPVVAFGFIEIFGRYVHVSFLTTMAKFLTIYVWSSALPLAITLLTLTVSKTIKPSFEAANGLDVVWLILAASLVLHALALILVLPLRGSKNKPRIL